MSAKIGMTPLEIKNALHNAGLNQAAVARAISRSRGLVSRVIDGHCISRPVHEAVAEAIGMSKEQIWPDRYLFQVKRKPGRPARIWRRRAA